MKDLELEKAAQQYQMNIGEEQYFPEDIETAFYAGAEWQEKNPHWISIKERLPNPYQRVLVAYSDGAVKLSFKTNEEELHWGNNVINEDSIRAWMPLPEYKKA